MEGQYEKSQKLVPYVIIAEKHESFKYSQHDDTIYLKYAFKTLHWLYI